MTGIASLFIHTASVETYTGSGAYGDVYAAPVAVQGFLEDGVVLVRTGTSEQFEQKSVFFAALADASKLTVGSRVTVNGRKVKVTATHLRDGGSLGLPSHVEADIA